MDLSRAERAHMQISLGKIQVCIQETYRGQYGHNGYQSAWCQAACTAFFG